MSDRIGFLGVFGSVEKNTGLLGGLMVTDDEGLPLEIRVCTPVKPGKIQRAAYGESLRPYVIADLIAKPLVGSLEYRPRSVLTNELLCLEVDSQMPVLFIHAAGAMVVTDEYWTRELPAHHRSEPLNIAQKVSQERDLLVKAEMILARTIKQFDPLEVFSRIERTITVLAEHDERFG